MSKSKCYPVLTSPLLVLALFAIANTFNSTDLAAQSSEAGLQRLMLEIRNAELKNRRVQARLDAIKKDRAAFAKKLAEVQQRRETGSKQEDDMGNSADSYSTIIKTLQSKRVDLLVDIAGMGAREKAAEQFRRELESGNQEIISQLEKLVEIQKSNLKFVTHQYKVASSSISELNAAQSKLIEVEIRLAEAKRQSKASALLDDIFVKSSLDQAEKKARLEMTESMLTAFTESRKNLDQQIALQQGLDQMMHRLKRLDSEISLGESKILSRKLQIEDWKSRLKPSLVKDDDK